MKRLIYITMLALCLISVSGLVFANTIDIIQCSVNLDFAQFLHPLNHTLRQRREYRATLDQAWTGRLGVPNM